MTDDFETHRAPLVRLAYRMLGSLSDAEDVVQDAFLRWRDVDHAAVANPRAYLARVVSRLCLDRASSASARRETYIGTWLPEPVVTQPGEPVAEDISFALLMTLERLSPLERAAFLLHDVFDMDYADIATALGRTEAACRQLAARARENVRRDRPRFSTPPDTREKVVTAFISAAHRGDVDGLASVLADDAVMHADGGGKRPAAKGPVMGRDALAAFWATVGRKPGFAPDLFERADINGLPGYVIHSADGVQTIAFEVEGDRIAAIYVVRNPDKLRHLS